MLLKVLASWIVIVYVISIKADSVDNLTVSVVVHERPLKDIGKNLQEHFREFINGYRLGYISNLAQFPNLWERITLKTVIWPTFPTPQYVLDTFCEEFLRNNVSVIIIIYKYDSEVIQFRYLMQLSNDVGIPVIIKKSVSHLGSPHPSVILETNPSVADEAEEIYHILSKFAFRQVCVMTSSIADGEDFYQELNKMQKMSPFNFEILHHIKLRVSEDKEFMLGPMFVIKMMSPQCRVIVLHMSKVEAQLMFPAAHKVGLTGREYQWIVTRSVFTHFYKKEPYLPVGTLGIFYDLYDEQPHVSFSKLFAKDFRFDNRFNFLIDVLGEHNQRIINEWIFMIANSFEILESGLGNYLNESNNNRLEYFKPDVNCERNSFERWTNGTALHKMFPVNKVMYIIQKEPWHNWKRTFFYTENNQAPHRIILFEDPPFVITRTPDHRENCKLPEVNCTFLESYRKLDSDVVPSTDSDSRCCSGLFIDLIATLSASLNFSYTIRVNDGEQGKKINETYNAVVHEMRHGRANMIFSSLIIKHEINTIGRASNLFLNASIAIMVAKKTDLPPAHAILQPFDILTWFVIVFVLIQVETWLIFAFEWLSPNGLNMKKILPQNHHFTLTQTYWLALTMLFKAPMSTVSPRGWPSLAIATSWAAFALIFIAIYTAKLANFMITSESYHKFKGISDERLLKSGMKVGTVPFESAAHTLQEDFPQLYQRMIPYNRVNVSEGIKALISGDLDAFIYDSVVLDYLAAQDKDCRLITLDNRYVKSGYGIALDEIDGALINNKIDRLVESGIITEWRDRWVGEPCKPNSNFQSISFDQFTSVFYLLALGIAIAVVIFVLEHCYSRYMMRVNRKQRSKEIIHSWWNLVTQVKLPEREDLDKGNQLPFERD